MKPERGEEMEYKVSELAEKAGVTKRTIHYYISKGLLMPPEGNGVNSLYSEEHLERILFIKKLQAEYMPLNKIRDYLLENPKEKKTRPSQKVTKQVTLQEEQITYIRENVCDVFEMHYTAENAEKYAHIIENVKKYVKKMMED